MLSVHNVANGAAAQATIDVGHTIRAKRRERRRRASHDRRWTHYPCKTSRTAPRRERRSEHARRTFKAAPDATIALNTLSVHNVANHTAARATIDVEHAIGGDHR